jgi:glycerate kinase
MRIVIAPQEYKGTLTAVEAARAMAEGAGRALPNAEIEEIPLSDGGPGLVSAIVAATGGRKLVATVEDPLGRTVEAEWGLLPDGSAVIEMAAAAGLWRLAPQEQAPRRTSTRGVGMLIRAALDAGCRSIIVGLGGSATNDGGAGMAAALGVRFLDARGAELEPGGAALARLARIDVSGLDKRLSKCRVIAAADVRNPLCGPEGASLVYGPQKGATEAEAQELDAALRRYAEVVEHRLGTRVIDVPGAGAAGGLGAGLIAFLGAEVREGFGVVAQAVRLRERIKRADLLITGEGRLDAQSVFGKTVFGVAGMAREAGVAVLVVPGSLGPGWEKVLPLVDGVEPVAGAVATEEEALTQPAAMLSVATLRALYAWRAAEGIRRRL